MALDINKYESKGWSFGDSSTPVEATPIPKEPNILQRGVQSVVRPFLKIIETKRRREDAFKDVMEYGRLLDEGKDEEAAKSLETAYSKTFNKETTSYGPWGGDITTINNSLEMVGVTAEVASYLLPTGRGLSVAPKVASWFGRGFAFNSGRALQDGKSAKDVVLEGTIGGATYVAFNGILSGISNGALKLLGGPGKSYEVTSMSLKARLNKELVRYQKTYGNVGGGKGPDSLYANQVIINDKFIKDEVIKQGTKAIPGGELISKIVGFSGSKPIKEMTTKELISAIPQKAALLAWIVPGYNNLIAPLAIGGMTVNAARTLLKTPTARAGLANVVKQTYLLMSKIPAAQDSRVAAIIMQNAIGNYVETLAKALELPEGEFNQSAYENQGWVFDQK